MNHGFLELEGGGRRWVICFGFWDIHFCRLGLFCLSVCIGLWGGVHTLLERYGVDACFSGCLVWNTGYAKTWVSFIDAVDGNGETGSGSVVRERLGYCGYLGFV